MRIALEGVPDETRKAFPDGTTMFERVLPGRDRMYPDTDSQPIAVTTEMLDRLGMNLPKDVAMRFRQMKEWGIPEDTWHYLLSKNLTGIVERIGDELGFDHREVGILIGHRFRSLEGRGRVARGFSYETLYDLFAFLKERELLPPMARLMLPAVVASLEPDFMSILNATGYTEAPFSEIKSEIPKLEKEFAAICYNGNRKGAADWIMGRLHMKAIGKIRLAKVKNEVSDILEISGETR
jgi:glutamyl-tRNA(Gln) amidotransferase subunit E